MKKTLLAVILTLCMIFTIMPITTFAADVTEHDLSTGSITIARNGNYLITQTDSETATSNTITVSATTANITIKDINIKAGNGSAFSIAANSSVEFTISGTNSLTGGWGYAGLWVPTGASVTIQSKDGSAADSLTAIGGGLAAGIGGSDNGATCGTVNIKSGTINAKGGNLAAGIGGGHSGNGGTIIITAEDDAHTVINATGGYYGAGIGGGGAEIGKGGDGGKITISAEEGGSTTVTATGSGNSAGIGGGSSGGYGGIGGDGSSGDINISAEEGGSTTVTATGGDLGVGIGGSYNGSCGKIEITGSTVVAKGKYIGIGSRYDTGSIDISDSTIIASGEWDSAIKAAAVTFDYNVDYIWRNSSDGLFSTTPYSWKAADKYLEIQIPVAEIELDEAALALNVGDSEALTATITPSTASDKTIIWTSSDEAVATVDENGQVVAVGVGEATITATSGDMTATCEITVTEPTPEETNGITGFLRMIKMILELIIYIFGLFAG